MAVVNPLEEEQQRAERLFNPRQPLSVLVVDGDGASREQLHRLLSREYGHVEVAANVETAEQLRSRCHFDLILMDAHLPGQCGFQWLDAMRAQGAASEVVLLTGEADLELAVRALRAGAADIIERPLRSEPVLETLRRCRERKSLCGGNADVRQEPASVIPDGIVGRSQAIRSVCEIIHRVAPTPATLLIEGPSGTGKELAARSLHRFSARSGAFVPINCGSISAELLESELFGHVKGAFTGAHQLRQGLFSYAHEGTLFMDEIGEMPLAMQAKVLRVLEERAIRPVGSEREVPVDVRIVAATNRNLAEEVKRGNFREDLFYRLNVISVRMPALCERKEDIPFLVEYFARLLSSQLGLAPLPLQAVDMLRLQDYPWPGNIRELKNVMERSMLLGKKPHECLGGFEPDSDPVSLCEEPNYPLDWTLDAVERHHMRRVLDAFGGNKSEAARRLGVSRKTLERKFP